MLLELLTDEHFFATVVIPKLALLAMRSMGCSCKRFKDIIHAHLHASTLSISLADVSWSNARFVAGLPHLQTLRVEGHPDLSIGHLRTLKRLTVSTLAPEPLLFFGAAIASSEAVLRLSDGSSMRNLEPLRAQPDVPFIESVSHVDIAALLGSLACNTNLVAYCTRVPGNNVPWLQQAFYDALPPSAHANQLVTTANFLAKVKFRKLMDARRRLRDKEHESWIRIFQTARPLSWDAESSSAADGDAEVNVAEVEVGLHVAAAHLGVEHFIDAPPHAYMYTSSLEYNFTREAVALPAGFVHRTFRRDVALMAVRRCAAAIRLVAPELQRDREVVLEAVRQNGAELLRVADEFRSDEGVVLLAMSRLSAATTTTTQPPLRPRATAHPRVIKAILDRVDGALFQSHDFVLQMMSMYGETPVATVILDRIGLALFQSREFVLQLMSMYGNALQRAPAFLGDREVVLAAVRSNGLALEFAALELRADREVVLAAVQEASQAHIGVDARFAFAMPPKTALQFALGELRADPAIVLAAVKTNGLTLAHAAPPLQEDRAMVLEAVRRNGHALVYADVELRANRETVLEAVKRHGKATMHISMYGTPTWHAAPLLSQDPEVLKAARDAEEDAWEPQSSMMTPSMGLSTFPIYTPRIIPILFAQILFVVSGTFHLGARLTRSISFRCASNALIASDCFGLVLTLRV